MEGYSESTEPIDAVNILPLARFEPIYDVNCISRRIYLLSNKFNKT